MKRKRRIQWYYSVILLAFGLTACQVKRPDTVISDAKMENVLYDFHIAKAMGEEVPYSESYKRVLYIESVYRKHGITQADFDTSMVWYARHPDALTKVYEKVNQRLKAVSVGIMIGAFIVSCIFGVNVVLIILVCGLLGVIRTLFAKRREMK